MNFEPKRLIRRIQANLQNPESAEIIQGLAFEFAALSSQANRRLEEIRAVIEKGQPIIAMEMAEAGFPLLDLIQQLQFPEESDWRALLREQQIPVHEAIVEEDLEKLRGLYKRPSADLSPVLYKDYRAAILRNNEELARNTLRAILRLDPEDANARNELIRLESKLIRGKEADLTSSMQRGETDRVLSLIDEMEQFPWVRGPGGTVWQEALRFRSSLQESEAHDAAIAILEEWKTSDEAGDVERAESLATEFISYLNQFDLQLSEEDRETYHSLAAALRERMMEQERLQQAERDARHYEKLHLAVADTLPRRKISLLKWQKAKEELEKAWNRLLSEQRSPEVEDQHEALIRSIDRKILQGLSDQRQLAIGVIFLGACALFISFILMFKIQRERAMAASIQEALQGNSLPQLQMATEVWNERRLPILRSGGYRELLERAGRRLEAASREAGEISRFMERLAARDPSAFPTPELVEAVERLARIRQADDSSSAAEALSQRLQTEINLRRSQLSEKTGELRRVLLERIREAEILVESSVLDSTPLPLLREDLLLLASLIKEWKILVGETLSIEEDLLSASRRLDQIAQALPLLREIERYRTLTLEDRAREQLQMLTEQSHPLVKDLDALRAVNQIWSSRRNPSQVWIHQDAGRTIEDFNRPFDSWVIPDRVLGPETVQLRRFLDQDLLERVWVGRLESTPSDTAGERDTLYFLGPLDTGDEQPFGVYRETRQTFTRVYLEKATDRVLQQSTEALVWVTDLDGVPHSGARVIDAVQSPESVFFSRLPQFLGFNERDGRLQQALFQSLDALALRKDLNAGFRFFVAERLLHLIRENPERWGAVLTPTLVPLLEAMDTILAQSSGLWLWLGNPTPDEQARLTGSFWEILEARPLHQEARIIWEGMRRLLNEPLRFIGSADRDRIHGENLPGNDGLLIGMNTDQIWDFLAFVKDGELVQMATPLSFSPLYWFSGDLENLLLTLPGATQYPETFFMRPQGIPWRLPLTATP